MKNVLLIALSIISFNGIAAEGTDGPGNASPSSLIQQLYNQGKIDHTKVDTKPGYGTPSTKLSTTDLFKALSEIKFPVACKVKFVQNDNELKITMKVSDISDETYSVTINSGLVLYSPPRPKPTEEDLNFGKLAQYTPRERTNGTITIVEKQAGSRLNLSVDEDGKLINLSLSDKLLRNRSTCDDSILFADKIKPTVIDNSRHLFKEKNTPSQSATQPHDSKTFER